MEKPKLVILGTGFAAFSLTKKLNARWYDVTVVSPRNHFIFTPLLPSTTVGTIEFRSIIESIRIAKPDVRYLHARCTAIDVQQQSIQCIQEFEEAPFFLPYDLLVIAVGAANNTYGISGARENALFLKELHDARAIRQRIIECFERASAPNINEAERKRLLHFVVVGGGPTGVEFAAEMHDFLVEDLKKSFHELVQDFQVTILEASDHILSTFDAKLGTYTMKHFRRQRIEVRTGSTVVRVEPDAIHLSDGSRIQYGLIVWSTGIGPIPFTQSLPFEKDRNGRILVDEFLRVKGYVNIYAAGDCATTEQMNLPATSQVAQQEGTYLAREFNRFVQQKSIRPFRYKHWGMLAYIGSNKALADLATIKGSGYTTWLFWRSVYLTKLVSLKNKILVIFDWLKTQFFGRDISKF